MNQVPLLATAYLLSSLGGGDVGVNFNELYSSLVGQHYAYLSVPFTSQAPEDDWSEPWKNACEETSLAMVSAFYSRQNLDTEKAKASILEIVSTKELHFGPSLDESVATMRHLTPLISPSFEVVEKLNPSVDELMQELKENRPVILPVYGKEFPNPYYQVPGPNYHVVVLMGYNDQKGVFLVHDPGSKFGGAMEFSYETVMEAIHDLNPSDFEAGEKRVLFTRPRF